MRKLIKLDRKFVKVIAMVADLHVGSRYAVCPDDYISPKDGQNLSAGMNKGQKQLLEYWKDYCKKMDELHADTVFIVGDAIQGINPAGKGLGVMTTDLDEQIEMAIKLLKPLCKNRDVMVWSGTPYHESVDFRAHKYIAEAFKGKFFSDVANLRFSGSSKIINVAHTSSEALIYPETSHSRDIRFMLEANALGKNYKANVIVRAHKHMFVEIHKYDIHYISLPCWQTFVPYEKSVRWYFKFQPDIGGAVLFIDDKDRVDCWHFLYPSVHIADELVVL